MPASSTDKLKKLSRRWVGQIGAAGVSDASTATIPLASTTNLPTDTAVVAVIDRVDANGVATPSLEETVIGVVSGSNLATSTRGAEGTAQAHSAGAVVEVLVTAKGWNDIIDHLLVEHNQDGTHGLINPTTPLTVKGTSSSAAEIRLSEDTDNGTNYVSLKAPASTANLTFTLPSADGTSGQALVTDAAGNLSFASAGSTDGWTASSDTWTYASASTFTIAGVDRTSVYTKGTKLKFTNTTLKYAVVASSSFSTDTTVTIYVNTDYVIANAAITSPYYSYQSNPQGFPEWFNFTPGSITGWAATPTTNIARYGVNGRRAVLRVDITGTSNATSVSFTVPLTAANTGTVEATTVLTYTQDNGATLTTPGRAILSTSTVTCYKDVASGAWTNVNSKRIQFTMVVEI